MTTACEIVDDTHGNDELASYLASAELSPALDRRQIMHTEDYVGVLSRDTDSELTRFYL